MTSSGKRALMAVSVLIAIVAAAALYLLLRGSHGPLSLNKPSAQPDLLTLLPSDAPILVYIDFSALRASSLGPTLASFSDPSNLDPDYAKFIRETGFDYSRDLDRLAFAAWPRTPAAAKGGNPQPPNIALLAVAQGRFDRAKIVAYVQRNGKVSRQGAIDVYDISSGSTGPQILLTFLSNDRIAISQGVPLDSAIAAANHPAPNPDLARRTARVAGSAIFAVARASDLATASGVPELQTGPIRKSINTIQLLTLSGQPDADKLTLSAEGQCDSLPHALQLVLTLQGLRFLGQAAVASAKSKNQMTPADAATLESILSSAVVSRSENFVRIRVDLNANALQGIAGGNSNPVPAPSHN
jgi:hypothetical protein